MNCGHDPLKLSLALKRLTSCYCGARILYALGLIAAPGKTAKPWLGELSNAASRIATRGLAARELVLCAGALGATLGGRSSPRRWLAACAASDAVDLGATLAADQRELPPQSKRGTALAAGCFGIAAAVLARFSPEDP